MAIERGLPEVIVVDNGPEFRSRALADIESFNGGLRDECLNANWFTVCATHGEKSKLAEGLQRTTPTVR
jgi:hypothetical protein